MEARLVEEAFESIFEQLAAVEHERWSHWQAYVHEKGVRQPDGALLISSHLVQHWEKQIATDYFDLSDEEKESDREQVRKYIKIIREKILGIIDSK